MTSELVDELLDEPDVEVETLDPLALGGGGGGGVRGPLGGGGGGTRAFPRGDCAAALPAAFAVDRFGGEEDVDGGLGGGAHPTRGSCKVEGAPALVPLEVAGGPA